MPTVLITGASRGIGYEFARQYADAGWRVFATCRTPDAAPALGALRGDVQVHRLDVSDFEAIDALAAELEGQTIDVLILNAGINPQPEAPPAELTDYDAWPEAFRVNCMSAVRTTVAFADHVAASDKKIVVAITSGNASIARNPGRNYVYRSTKAALNLCMHGLSVEFAPRGHIIAVLSPGHVRTDMGGPNARLTPEESISAMRGVIERMTEADRGRFIQHDGSDWPW